MKLFQFDYKNEISLRGKLHRIRQYCEEKGASKVLFHIFTDSPDKELIDGVCAVLDQEMPDAEYAGCSTNGNISSGDFSPSGVSITCMVFSCPSIHVETLQYRLTEDVAIEVTDALKREVKARPWVKAVELVATIRGLSMSAFCDNLHDLDPSIQVFGGGAFSGKLDAVQACVFSKKGSCMQKGVAFVLYGGDDFYLSTQFVSGWKPLGKEMRVTRATGNIVYELDGQPTYDAYYRYLKIKNDENFFFHTIEFPFYYIRNGVNILRDPVCCNEDGSIEMTSDVKEGATGRLAYGDPMTILDSVAETRTEVAGFSPEAILIFSCAGRRLFWGDDRIGRETQPFESLAPTFGFFTSSEFLRTNGYVNQHNVTLVIAAMREGEPKENTTVAEKLDHTERISMIHRLATFINMATKELEEANQKLHEVAITDALTGLYNRGEIQRRIEELAEAEGEKEPFSLIMIDLDDFKKVNDTYGHKIGDEVLTGLADFLQVSLHSEEVRYMAGRWGGEEFMIVLPGMHAKDAAVIAEKLRNGFAAIEFKGAGRQTMSLGVTEYISGEDTDDLCIRVDDALYAAKRNGKNRVVLK
ncbi:MAG: diguanylate cyclase [Acidaminococcaceae bacterium]|nr:diguanylate cyclase [Acidaminococcaceae bacterium]MBQ6779315.1 diguanylate cyclase [Acidaminococcaceae bacterium]